MPIPGGEYTAIQNADGTWDVLDVPIVHDGTIPRFNREGEKVDEFPTDAKWFRHVLAVHARAGSEGRMGRAFIDHHPAGSSESQPDAGYLQPTRIGPLVVDGEEKAALYANLISIPDEVYQTWVKTGRLAGRSIESLVAERGWIDGLALMPTRAAHYSLPILTIGEEVVPGGTGSGVQSDVRAVACASESHARAIFAKESTMPDFPPKDDDKEGEKDSKDSGGESKSEGGGDSKGWKAALDALKSCDIAIDDIAEVKSAIEEWTASLGGEGEAAPAEEIPELEPEAEEAPVLEDVPVAEQGMAAKSSDRVMRAEAKADAARTEVAALRAERKQEKLIAAALRRMESYGIGSDPEAVLVAKFKEGGETGLKIYVETMEAHGVRSPGLGGSVIDEDTPTTELPPAVMAYTDPGERAVALKAYRQFDEQTKEDWPMDGRSLEATIKRAIDKAK